MNASRLAVLALLLAALVLLLVPLTLAQSDGGYDLGWWTVDGGGATFSTGGGYALGGTIGQSDAGAPSPAATTPWSAASGAARGPNTGSTCRWW